MGSQATEWLAGEVANGSDLVIECLLYPLDLPGRRYHATMDLINDEPHIQVHDLKEYVSVSLTQNET